MLSSNQVVNRIQNTEVLIVQKANIFLLLMRKLQKHPDPAFWTHRSCHPSSEPWLIYSRMIHLAMTYIGALWGVGENRLLKWNNYAIIHCNCFCSFQHNKRKNVKIFKLIKAQEKRLHFWKCKIIMIIKKIKFTIVKFTLKTKTSFRHIYSTTNKFTQTIF